MVSSFTLPEIELRNVSMLFNMLHTKTILRYVSMLIIMA